MKGSDWYRDSAISVLMLVTTGGATLAIYSSFVFSFNIWASRQGCRFRDLRRTTTQTIRRQRFLHWEYCFWERQKGHYQGVALGSGMVVTRDTREFIDSSELSDGNWLDWVVFGWKSVLLTESINCYDFLYAHCFDKVGQLRFLRIRPCTEPRISNSDTVRPGSRRGYTDHRGAT